MVNSRFSQFTGLWQKKKLPLNLYCNNFSSFEWFAPTPNLSTRVCWRKYSHQGKCVCSEGTWVRHDVRLGWLTLIFSLHFPSPALSARLLQWHLQLWNLADSSAGPDTGDYVNSTTKQLPDPLGWRPVMTWVSPRGLVPLGSNISPCQTLGPALYCWCEGLCQQNEAFHYMISECKALERRQRQQKKCSISVKYSRWEKISTRGWGSNPKPEAVRNKLSGNLNTGSACESASPPPYLCIHFHFPQERDV